MPVEPQGADPTPSAEDEASDASVVSEPPITTGFGPPEGSHAEFGMVKLSPTPTPTRTQSQRGALRMGQLRVRGGLPPEVVARVLRQNFGRWTACYERELAENPKLSGMVELKFGLDAHGAVQAPSVGASSLAAPRLQRCLVKDLRQLAFPAPSELPTEVTEQLHLEPRGQKPKNAEVPAND